MWETVSSDFPQHAVKDMVHLWASFLRVSELGLMFMDPAVKDTTGLGLGTQVFSSFTL